jgi:hypothetical protein
MQALQVLIALLGLLLTSTLAQVSQPTQSLASLTSQWAGLGHSGVGSWIGVELPSASNTASEQGQQRNAVPAFLLDLMTACRTVILGEGSSIEGVAGINATQMLEQAQSWADALEVETVPFLTCFDHDLDLLRHV